MKTFLLATLAFLLLGLPAWAQDTTVNLGDLLDPWLQLLLAFAALVIPALGTWAAAELRRRTGIALELAHMQTFQQALVNGAGLVLAKTRDTAAGVNIDVKNALIKEAILYVNNSAPDAVAYFGLTPEAIAEKLVAKIGIAQPTANVTNVTNVTGGPPA